MKLKEIEVPEKIASRTDLKILIVIKLLTSYKIKGANF